MTDPIVLVTDVNIVDVVSGGVESGSVAVAGERLVHAGPTDDFDADGEVVEVDGSGGFVCPGLINLHVHLGLVLPGAAHAHLANESTAALALRMAANANAALMAGVTTVRLVHERDGADMALRASIAAWQTPGPTIVTAGHGITATGGHGHDVGFVQADGPDAIRRAVRDEIDRGADWIKLAISGGISGMNEGLDESQLTVDEVSAATGTAHERGRKVTAHAGPAAGIAGAIEAGLDCVEHGYLLDEPTVQLMAERGTWLVPTIGVTRCDEFYAKVGAPAWMVEKAHEVGEIHWRALEMAIHHGVPIGLGTDMFPHEPFDGTTATVREMEFLADAGMGALAALQAGTIGAARLIGLDSAVGSLEAGKRADFVITSENPLSSPRALRSIDQVWSRGRRVR